MENQHRKITGYRELTQDDIDLMNKIKEHGNALGMLCDQVAKRLTVQRAHADGLVPGEERDRLDRAEPEKWIAIARLDLQQGLMALTRAVAQPGSF